MTRFALLLLLVAGCADAAPEGFLQTCDLTEDCGNPELECLHISNNYSGFLTDERYCTKLCTSNAECPELVCSDWVGTELECLGSATTGGVCGEATLGDAAFQACGM